MEIKDLTNPWRTRLRAAHFKGAQFHVEQQMRSSGRRVVLHEYPKRDDPYAEDMGRHAVAYRITGYVIRPRLSDLEARADGGVQSADPGTLYDPAPREITVMCQALRRHRRSAARRLCCLRNDVRRSWHCWQRHRDDERLDRPETRTKADAAATHRRKSRRWRAIGQRHHSA